MDKNTIGHFLHGNGATKVIALHSWMDDAQSWKATILLFESEQIYLCLYGCQRLRQGLRQVIGQYNLQEIKEDIFQLADALGFSAFHLIGHSMCGMAAQYAALRDKSNRLEKVVLVTPVSSGGFPADEETKGFLKAIVHNVEVAKMGYGAFTANRYSDYWYTMRAERHVEVTNANAQRAYMKMWLEEDFREEMSKVEKPFLVISGTYDHPLFKMDAQKKNFEGFKRVEFIECENSGHFPMQEAPVYLASAVEAFLN